jgi:hypothetical protein
VSGNPLPVALPTNRLPAFHDFSSGFSQEVRNLAGKEPNVGHLDFVRLEVAASPRLAFAISLNDD